MLLRWIAITAVLVAPAAASGCRGAPRAAPVPQALAAVPPPPPPPPAPPMGPGGDPIAVCLVKGGRITEDVTDSPVVRGDTTEEYASRTPWYVANEPVTFNGKQYYKYGLPRVLGPRDVMHIGSYQGVAVFAEPDADLGHPVVLFLPVHSACEFQPYQIGEVAGAVRG